MRYNNFQKICAIFLSWVLLISVLPAEVIAKELQAMAETSVQPGGQMNSQLQTGTDETIPEDDGSGLPVDEKIYMDNGLVLKMNEDGKSLSVVDFINIKATSVQIPDSYLGVPISGIEDLAFKGKTALQEVILSDNIRHIGDDVFFGCTSLQTLEENGARYIRSATNDYFYLLTAVSNDITECIIPEGTKIIASYAFHNCKALTEIVIPESVIQVGFRSLRGCDNLQSVTLPFAGETEDGTVNNHVGFAFGARTYGGNISFVPVTLTSLIIKRGKLQQNALYGLDSVQHLGMPSMQQPLGYYYGVDNNYLPAALTSVEVASGALPEKAFYNCVNLQNIVLGDDVTITGSVANTFYNTPFYTNADNMVDGFLYSGNCLIKASSSLEGNIIIREGTVSIAARAFGNCTGITSISIPNSVTSIGSDAFIRCNGLTAVHITDLAAWCSIDFANDSSNPLYYAKNLYLDGELVTELVFPESVTSISNNAFYGYTNLTSVAIPESVTSIGSSAFSNCTNLSAVNISDSVTSVGSYAFYYCTGLTSVTIGSGVTSIGSSAFRNCTNLSAVSIPDSVAIIGSDAFSYCTGLTSVTIGSGVTSIGGGAFYNCTALEETIFNATAMGDLSDKNYVFYNAGKDGDGITVTIGANVTRIPAHLFNPSSSATYSPKIISVVFEEGSICQSIGTSAFAYGNSLTAVYITDLAAWCNIVFENVSANPLYYAKNLYLNGELLTEAVIPEGVTGINDYAFYYGTCLTSVTISDSVTSIGNSAFYRCAGLTSVTIGNGVTDISNYAFYNCTALEEINFNVTAMGDLSDKNYVFYNAGKNGNGITVTIGANVTRIPAHLFDPYSSATYSPKIVSVVFEEGSICQSIGESAFAYCESLTAVYITDLAAWCNIVFENISANPRYYAENLYLNGELLTEVVIPEGVTSIGASAFYYCTSVTSITIPESVTSIGASAFNYCWKLTSIVYHGTYQQWVEMVKGANWDSNTGTYTIYCTDATIDKAGNVTYLEVEESANAAQTSAAVADSAISSSITTTIQWMSNVARRGATVRYGATSLKTVTTTQVMGNVATVSATEDTYSEGLEYTSNGDGTCYVSGIGTCVDKDVVIPSVSPAGDTVTGIGASAFNKCTKLTSIAIPDSVTSIGRRAFYYCTGLTSVTIGSSVTSIGDSAFYYCPSLTTIMIPDNVTSIGNDAFYNCVGLTSITIGGSVTSIGASAFSYCTGLTSVAIPDSVTSIGASAFNNCVKLTSIAIPDSVTNIGGSAFKNCTGLTSVTIGNGVTSMGVAAFYNCTGLKKINFNAVSMNDLSYNANAFYSAGRNTEGIVVTIAANVSKIPAYLFYSNDTFSFTKPNIVSVIFEEGSVCKKINDFAFSYCTGLNSITIPDSVTNIGASAFSNCTGLTSVTIGNGVTSIGAGAFSGCSGVTAVYITDLAAWCAIDFRWSLSNPLNEGGNLYLNGELVTELRIPEGMTEIGNYVFYNCRSLTSVTIPDSVTSIGNSAFYNCTGMTAVYTTDLVAWCTIDFANNYANPLSSAGNLYFDGKLVTELQFPEEITEIGEYVFCGCRSITTVTIPAWMTDIGAHAFADCAKLTRINFNATAMNDLLVDTEAFYNAGVNADGITVKIGANVTKIPAYLFSITSSASCSPKINSVVFEEDSICASIGASAFQNCTGLPNITLPDSVTSIGAAAFQNCTGLTSITIPDRVTSIGDHSFSNCTNLSKVIFADGTRGALLRSVGSQAFAGTSIGAGGTIEYPSDELAWRFVEKATDWDGGLTTKDSFVFGKETVVLYEMSDDRSEFYVGEYSGTGETANIPEYFSGGRTVTQAYEKAFYNAQGLKIVIVPDTINYICQNVFYNCPDLAQIVVYGGDVVIERGMIYGCDALNSLTIPFLGHTVTDAESAYLGYFFGAENYRANEKYVPLSLKTVTLTDVTEVANHAFEDCRYLQAIILPDAVSFFGEYAFAGCESLAGEWVLPLQLNTVGAYAFASCTSLRRVVLPEGLSEIGKFAFSNCLSMQEMTLPDSVTNIGVMILDNCNNVRKIRIGSGLQYLPDTGAGNSLFGINKAQSALANYEISAGNTKFATDDRGILYELHDSIIAGQRVEVAVVDAPAKSDLTDYELPEHIVYIAPYAFAYNTTLRWIQLDRVRRIDKCAFLEATALVAAVFGSENGVDAEAAQYAQQYGTYIADKHRENESYSQIIGDQAFFGCTMLQYVNIWTDFVDAVGQEAFYGCGMLTSVRLSESVQHIGQRAFGKTALESITVDDDNARYVDFDQVLYEKLEDGSYKLLIFPACKTATDTGSSEAVVGKVYQTTFELPADIPVSVIESYAFQNAKYLKVITLEPVVEMLIGDYAFQNAGIQTVYIGGNVTSLGLIRGEGEYTVFESCESLSGIEVSAENPYYSSEGGVLFDKAQTKLIKYPYHKVGGEYSLPDTVAVIASMAFKGNKNLNSIVVRSYVHTVGLEAFYDCSNLVTIYFDHVYAPLSVLENAFTTNTETGAETRALLCYSSGYGETGSEGEFGWNNYKGIYPLYESNVVPNMGAMENGNVYYAVVVVDSSGLPIDGAQVSLTDFQGETEVITAAGGIAMFYDNREETEIQSFAIDFDEAYVITVVDPSGTYYQYTNPALYLDENMLITYITMTQLPTVYGVSCDEMDVNSERVELNKANVDFTELLLDANGNIQYAADGVTPLFREVVEISVIGYCDSMYSFVDGDGLALDNASGLYQNGVKIASVERAEQQDNGVILYFYPQVSDIANEVDIEVRLTAVHEEGHKLSCSTVLNVHVFDFCIDESALDLDSANVGFDLGMAGEFLSALLGDDKMEVPLGKNIKFTTKLDKDTITFQLKGSKDLIKNKKKINNDYEKGFNENNKRDMSTYRFQYTAPFIGKDGTVTNLRYNITFTRETEDSGFYYYRCKVHNIGNGTRATDKNLITTFYGAVNKPGWGGNDTRSAAKLKADLIFCTSYAYILKNCKKIDDVKGAAAKECYREAIIDTDINQKVTTQKLEASLSGDVSFQYVEGGSFRCTGGTIKGSLVYKFSHDQQFTIWVIPVTLHVEVKASGEIALKVVVDEDKQIDWDLLLTLELDIAANIGVGCSVASVGFYGELGTVFVLEILPEFGIDSWKVYGEMGAYAKVLWHRKNFRFTPDSWKEGYYIIKPESTATAESSGDAEVMMVSESTYMASLYLADSYTSTDAQSLQMAYRPVIIDGELYKICYADVSGMERYDAYNYVKLALSKWDGESWSEPRILDDNGLNDADYMLYQDGDSLMMVYTQQTVRMTEDTVNDTYSAAQNLQIKVVELSNEAGMPEVVASPTSYAYLTKYAEVNGVPTVVWAENTDNNAFGVSPYNYIDNSGVSHVFETTANSVWTSRYVDGAWTAPECVADNLSAITQIAVTDDGYIAYIVDTNGDLTDTTDRVLYYGIAGETMTALNNTAQGSVSAVIADAERFLYYYDAAPTEDDEGEALWKAFSAEDSAAEGVLPENIPEEFELLYDANGDIWAVLYSKNKTWSEAGQKKTGSAIYGLFRENDVWGEEIELSAYAPIEDRYVQEFTAVLINEKILIGAATVDSTGDNLLHTSGTCTCGPMLTAEQTEIDYAGGCVTFVVKNQGTSSSDIYMSVGGAEYVLISEETLMSGAEVQYTVSLPDAAHTAQTVSFALSQDGDGAVFTESVSLAYSDLQTNAKQLLLGDNDFLLFSVKNTGNTANAGITIIRRGEHDAATIAGPAVYQAAMALKLKAGEVTAFTFVNENHQIETAWAVMDLVEPGAISYHELVLSELVGNTDETLVGIYTIPTSQIEPDSLLDNNFSYLNYGACQGVLQDGETAENVAVLDCTEMVFDSQEAESLTIKFFSAESDSVMQVRIGDVVLEEGTYSVTALTVGGQILIPGAVLANMHGTHTVQIVFASGTACQMTLSVLAYYTVLWTDDGQTLWGQEVREGAVPELTVNMVKEPDAAWVYTFEGWDYTGDGVVDPIVAVTENVTYNAVWVATPRAYTIQWSMLDAAGAQILIAESYLYGDIPSYLGPVFAPDEMMFAGWDKAVMPVTGDETYTATYAVIKPTMVGIEIGALPNKLTYMQGQTMDLTGLVLYKVMSDGTKTVIHNNLVDVSADLAEVGTTDVWLSYAGFTASFSITVDPLDESLLPRITVANGETAAGRTVTVAINVENNPGIISLRYRVAYDETALELIRVQDAGLLLGYNEPAPGIYSPYTLHWIDSQATENNEADGIVIYLTFLILDTAEAGVYEISVEPVEARNCNGEQVSFLGSVAEIHVIDVLLGDVDRDGEVTDWDVILLKRYLAGWPDIDINLLAADADADGEVTDWDCILIDRYLMGWYDTLG